ncbi:hypothetical protein JCGZ_17178 [Jatropha curcas]|uniref:ADP-ribosyl cyclase/cyclic ADP-ribose hydrolase n=1 Tax=Jatropha curcas TaxID=180498 RepID=A0A067LAS3_JATCU|nr:hypothetical protein JCGZ_17178 [Jatropha curcas]
MSSISSSTVPPKTNYDVFLSFRGVDTRLNFTSHLYAALRRKHITTFIDYTGLETGEEISPNLLKAIEESKMSVIIFSKNYASSQWCLDELVKIMECMKSIGQKVLPIFYRVDPSDVRNQTGNFGDGFRKVKEQFQEDAEKIDRWITALTKAANLSGWDSNNYRYESELSEGIVNRILKKLYPAYYSVCSNLPGIDLHINNLLSLLSIGSEDVRFIGIWGMGGIGKTTIAEVLLSRIFDKFDDCCFLSNIREKSEKDGLFHLRKCLFSKLLQIQNENLNLEMYHVLPTIVLDMLSRKKVLIVLDDVNDSDQLEALAGHHNWFGPRSRVIMTSRDKEVLDNGVDITYRVEGLQYRDALKLLSMKAFKQKHPPKDFIQLSERVLNYAKAVPLALKVLGSHLCKRSPKEWESVLDKLKQFPDSKIQKILEVSYDTLEQNEKDIFLDVACFFKGQDKDWVEDILNGCGLAASMGINRLKDKCLVVIVQNNLEMHDLIQEMGQDIARRRGSRLWNPKNICDTLTTETMKEAVEGIFLDMSKMGKVHLNHAIFSWMPNLRSLIFFRSQYCSKNKDTGFMLESPQSNYLQYLSNKLSLLHWEEYPYKSMPSSFFMENLVQLDLRESRIEQLWTGDKCPQQLKYLNLFGCMQLTRLPNLSSATNLEWIILGLCMSLIEIPSSIQCLLKLKYLDLYRCEKLRTLPNLIQLKSLAHLRLSYCSNLKTALEIPRSIQVLELERSGLEEFSPNVQVLDDLQYLSMWQCKNLRSLPRCLNLNYVIKQHILNLTGCLNLKKFPVILGKIEVLMLNQTGIEELPSSIQYLSSLVELEMKNRERLQSLPSSICELKLLQKFVLSGCSKLNKLPPLYGLYSLEELYLDGSRLKEIPSDIVSRASLRVLNLKNCDKLQGLPELPCRLMELQAVNCTSVKTAESSSSFACIGHLRKFWPYKYLFNYCNCINLSKNVRCKIVEDVRQRIEEIAFGTALSHRRAINNSEGDIVIGLPEGEIPEWNIVIGLPGGEIPEWDAVVCLFKNEVPEWDTIGFPSRIPKWFSYQGQGSSFSILFPPNWFDVLGFTFCAVIEFDIPLNKCDDFFITCECHFKSDNGGRKVQFRSSTIHLEAILQSDHLFLWYNNFHTTLNLREWLIRNNVNEGLCEFKAEARGFNKVKLKVNRCGLMLNGCRGNGCVTDSKPKFP